MLDIQSYIGAPRIYLDEKSPLHTDCVIAYLPRGFGHTLWNALRRLILWYDYGASITWFSLSGVSHEYSVLDGVDCSVFDILLRLKQLRFSLMWTQGNEVYIQGKLSWIGEFKASNLVLPAWVTLLSDDCVLCTITDPKVSYQYTIRVEKGSWYYTIEYLEAREKEKESQDIDLILIDNDFRVVDTVTYHVDEVLDDLAWSSKDKLTISLYVKYPTISVKDILSFAWEVLASYGKLFIYEDAYLDKSMFVDYQSLDDHFHHCQSEEPIKVMPIDALSLTERTRNALIKNDILYVEDLVKKKKNELLTMKWVGRKAVDEINVALSSIGKSLIA